MKYIDAEKLYKQVDELMARFAKLEKEAEPDTEDLSIFYQGKKEMCSELLGIIDSLQKEQPIQVNTLTWKDINDIERIINNVHYEFRNGIGEKSFGEEVLERFMEEKDEQEQSEVDLEKAAEKYAWRKEQPLADGERLSYFFHPRIDAFKEGAKWYAQHEQSEAELYNNGWIDCAKQMPKETKQWSDTMQGHKEWTESDRVLVWDSIYGCGVDATKNGKWMSEQRGGYTGQVVHGIIAWRPIPEFNEELLFNARKEE